MSNKIFSEDNSRPLDNDRNIPLHDRRESSLIKDIEEAPDADNDEIARARHALSLIPKDHPNRAFQCYELQMLLEKRVDASGTLAHLQELIESMRDTLDALPVDHPGHVSCLSLLAIRIRKQFDMTGDCQLLEQAINFQKEALLLLPMEHRDRAASCVVFASALMAYYDETKRNDILDEAVPLARELLTTWTADHLEQASLPATIATKLAERFITQGDVSQLHEAISMRRDVLRLLPEENPLRPETCFNLSVSLRILYTQTEDQRLLDEAINIARGLLVSPTIERARACVNFSILLRDRSRVAGANQLLEEALEFDREALNLRPPGHTDRAASYQNLATSLLSLFKHNKNRSLIDESIDLARKALELHNVGHSLRAASCETLADSLVAYFEEFGGVELLHEAILLQKETVSLRPAGHVDRAVACTNLARSCKILYDYTGNISLLDEFIALNREALRLWPQRSVFRATSCQHLSLALGTRLSQTGDHKLLDEGISLAKEALSLRSPDHPLRAASCINLAQWLHLHFIMTRDVLILDEALRSGEEALRLRPVGHPDRAAACTNCALLLKAQFKVSRDRSTLEEAIVLQRETWSCYLRVILIAGSLLLIEEVVGLLKASLTHISHENPGRWRILINLARIYMDPDSPERDWGIAAQYLHDAISPTADDLPALLAEASTFLESVNESDPEIEEEARKSLLESYTAVIDLAQLVAGFALDNMAQLKYLAASRNLGSGAYCLARAVGDLNLGLKLLERARGIFWSQLLHLRVSEHPGVAPDIAAELDALLRRLGTRNIINSYISEVSDDSASALTESDLRHQHNNRVQVIIRGIRSQPGMENFMRGPTRAALMETATDHPVIVLICGKEDCHALVIPSTEDTLCSLRLEDLKPSDLKMFARRPKASRMRGAPTEDNGGPPRSGVMKSRSSSSFLKMLAKLWKSVAKPIIECLNLKRGTGQARSRIHWCPTGAFNFVPIHAAGIYDGPKRDRECVADYVVSSYTPTLAALSRAQDSMSTFSVKDTSLLLIAADGAHDRSLPILLNIKEETQLIVQIASNAGIPQDVCSFATRAQVTTSITSAQLVHVACHGVQDGKEPLKSAFHLSDGCMTVSQLMELDLKDAFFAFLSACETAKVDEDQLDQTIHLAATMLFVGFKSVVATMWAMHDADGPRIAGLFYERLFESGIFDAGAIPFALDYAVAELRKNGMPPERWATFIHMGA